MSLNPSKPAHLTNNELWQDNVSDDLEWSLERRKQKPSDGLPKQEKH